MGYIMDKYIIRVVYKLSLYQKLWLYEYIYWCIQSMYDL